MGTSNRYLYLLEYMSVFLPFALLRESNWVYGFGGLERWNGMVEWTGMEWTAIL